MANKVEVDLQILANNDLDRLVKALNGFTKGIIAQDTGGNRAPGDTPGIEGSLKESRDSRLRTFWDSAQKRVADVQVAGGSVGSYANSIAESRAARFAGGTYGALGSVASGSMNAFGKVERGIGMVPWTAQAIQMGVGAMSNAATGGSLTNQGAQLGYSGNNGAALSDAFRFGIGNITQNMGAVLTNPFNVSGKDVANFQSAMQGMGWNTQDGAGRSMYNFNTDNNNLLRQMPMDFRSQLFDSTRYGAASISQVGKQLTNLGDAASAAHMSVAQFAEATKGVADQMAGQYGTPLTVSTEASKAMAMATGLSPTAAMSGVNDLTMRMQLAKNVASGSANPYLATYGSSGGMMGAQQTSMDMVARISGLGNNMNDARKILKSRGRDYVLNALYRSFVNSRQLWPTGISPQQYLNMLSQGRDDTSMHAQTAFTLGLDNVGKHVSASEFTRLTADATAALGGGASARKTIQDAIAQSHGNKAAALKEINRRLGRANNAASGSTALGNVNITLQGAAARIFNVTPADTSNGNKSSVARAGTASIPVYAQGVPNGGSTMPGYADGGGTMPGYG